MLAVSKLLTAGVGIAALAGAAAPAAAQYYPGYGYGGGGNVVGQVLNQVLGGNRYNYGNNSQYAVQRCAAAVEQRINRGYGNNGYGYGNPYGYGSRYGYNNGYGQGYGRVLGVTSVERRSNGLRVRGVATANAYAAGYGGGYGGYGYQQPQGELRFKCNVDYRGYIRDIDLTRNNYYGYRGY